jgi:predicted nucleic acid-binding protein
MIVVSDTSPITNLAAIEKLDLLHLLYGTITIPVAVYNELTPAGTDEPVPGTLEVQTLPWIVTRPVQNTRQSDGALSAGG